MWTFQTARTSQAVWAFQTARASQAVWIFQAARISRAVWTRVRCLPRDERRTHTTKLGENNNDMKALGEILTATSVRGEKRSDTTVFVCNRHSHEGFIAQRARFPASKVLFSLLRGAFWLPWARRALVRLRYSRRRLV